MIPSGLPWEYFGETNHLSLNDFINTMLGGIALGEIAHRTAWLIRSGAGTGTGSLWRELVAATVDPIGAINRLQAGDASRTSQPPADLLPHAWAVHCLPASSGERQQRTAYLWTARPFVQADLLYGDTANGHSRTPYDAFSVEVTAGGGGGVSEVRVRGRLFGATFYGERFHLSVMQSYSFLGNGAYRTGAQSIDARVGVTPAMSGRTSLTLLGWGGVTVLGAVDSRPPGDPAQDVSSIGSPSPVSSRAIRQYDYGPGTTFGVSATLSRDHRTVVLLLYEGRTSTPWTAFGRTTCCSERGST